jgi:type VI secretion system secreted protein VgrG
MPNLSNISLTIDGKNIRFDTFTLQTSVIDHHELIINTDAQDLGDMSGSISAEEIKNYIGKPVYLKVENKGIKATPLTFNGVVTNIKLGKGKNSYDRVILMAKSESIIADGQMHFATYTGDLKKVAEECFMPWGHMLKCNISNNPSIEYTAQYGETAYQYLQRLAQDYGLWFYFDGDKLILGDYQETHKIDLDLGRTIVDADLSLSIKSMASNGIVYSYKENDTYKFYLDEANLQDSDAYGNELHKTSLDLYNKKLHGEVIIECESNDELKNYISTEMNRRLADLVVLKGNSENPEVRIGARIIVKDKETTFGSYHVIEARHVCDFNGHFTNSFKAIPSMIKIPFDNPNVKIPKPNNELAVVVENEDPKHIGRVKVNFRWQRGDQSTPWIRILYPYAGGGGFYFTPEKLDQVMISYEQDNPDRPVVIGSVVHGKSKATDQFFNKFQDNNKKMLVSKKGHRIEFLEEGEGAGVYLTSGDLENVITISEADGKITLESKHIVLKANTIKIKASSIDIEASNSLSLKGNEIEIKSTTTAALKGSQVNVEADAIANLKGGIVNIN